MLDFSLMLWVKLPVDRIQLQSNKFATSAENETTGDSKLNDSPGSRYVTPVCPLPAASCCRNQWASKSRLPNARPRMLNVMAAFDPAQQADT